MNAVEAVERAKMWIAQNELELDSVYLKGDNWHVTFCKRETIVIKDEEE